MDDAEYFMLEDERPTPFQLQFLAELRALVNGRVRPYCVGWDEDQLFLQSDFDAPGDALVSVGLELTASSLRGDRISIHDRTFPPTPTRDGFVLEGTPTELAVRGSVLLEFYDRRPVVRHEWIHRRRVYALCYLYNDTGERLAQMYRSDWAPQEQEARLVAQGFVRGRGWIQTEGLGAPDRIIHVRGIH